MKVDDAADQSRPKKGASLHMENNVDLSFLDLGEMTTDTKKDDSLEIFDLKFEGDGNGEDKSKTKEKVDEYMQELPEGWVRCGKGLKLDIPITPSLRAVDSSKRTPVHFCFANNDTAHLKKEAIRDNDIKTLQMALMRLDRNVIQDVKYNSTKIRAEKVPSRSRGAHLHCLSKTDTAQKIVASTASTNSKIKVENEINDRRITLLKKQHAKELVSAKQEILSHVDGLIRKYRQLAIDAVEVARSEQRKCELQRRYAYSAAYDACTKYENDLKETVRGAIKELQSNAEFAYNSVVAERDSLKLLCQNLTENLQKHNIMKLDRLTSELCDRFKDNNKFTMSLIDDCKYTIIDEYDAFKDKVAGLLTEKFKEKSCELKSADANSLIDYVLALTIGD